MKVFQSTWRVWAAMAALLLANLFLVGCGSLEPMPTTDKTSAGAKRTSDADYSSRFQIGDLVKIDFSGTTIQQIPPHEEHIKDDGSITLPYIGKIQAAGKTAGELQQDIQKAYVPKYFRNLTITVKGSDLFYYVGGRVKLAGRQLYLGPVTVTGAIKSAGDFDDYANRRKVKLIRADGSIHIVNAIKAQDNPQLDLPVYPGDKIEVPQSWF